MNRSSHAFTRIEAVVVVLTLLAIGAALSTWLHITAIRAERAPCLGNLKLIGGAMAMYADDNQARLPYGGLRRDKGKHWTWDDLLNQQLGGQFPKKQLEASEPSLDMPVLRCPSDRVAIAPEFVRGHRRTYAMPAHNMADENWPPGPANRTGIGIQWNIGPNVPSPVFSNKWVYPAKDVELGLTPRQLSFTTAMIPRPSKSIAVTEYLKKDNIIGHCTRATVANAAEQIQTARMQPGPFHHGTFSYLFLDGHAESLDPLKTLDPKSRFPTMPTGMWIVAGSEH